MHAPTDFDVIAIGGGAAGLMAAAAAARSGLKTILLEKNRKLGVKILMSGGTRCNITHNCDVRGIVSAFGRNGNFLHSALSAFSPQDVVNLMHDQGVATKIEDTGKIFPVSNKAIDVRDALVQYATESGATIANQQAVKKVDLLNDPFAPGQPGGPRYAVHSETDSWRANTLIVTTGGLSYPGCGTTGDGYHWAEQFGHSIVSTVPALVPITSRCQWANELKGITIAEASLSVWAPAPSDQKPVAVNADGSKVKKKKAKHKPLAKRDGSFLFTHWGFSGPSVLDVSREVARHPQKNTLTLMCDFLPGRKASAFSEVLRHKKHADGKQLVGNLLNDFFPKRFADSLLAASGAIKSVRNAELSSEQLSKIVEQVKQCQFPITGTLGFEKAEVTAGGINLGEVDSRTMESKLQPGLFFAGEVLDLDGFIGGFNFQSAFSTGWLAGISTAYA